MLDSPNRLRIFQEPEQAPRPADAQIDESVAAGCRAFSEATGWRLAASEQPPEDCIWSLPLQSTPQGLRAAGLSSPVFLYLAGPSEESKSCPEAVLQLAQAMGAMAARQEFLSLEIWRREAELAASPGAHAPSANARPDGTEFADRLTDILQEGARAVGCTAAGVYLIDDSDAYLKLRAMWNLPPGRLLNPPRPLRGSVAELEALIGQAVVLENTAELPHWRVPEPYPAAVCVPIANPGNILGILWMFADQPRTFSRRQTNQIEMVAGRIADELDRQ